MNWSQLKTVIWLRLRLTRNQFLRGGAANQILAVLGFVVGVLVGAGAAVGGLVLGAVVLDRQPPLATLLAWDGIVGVFLFLWIVGVIAELQRSEAIDLSRLLHLPVSLRGIFFMNYIASHVTFSLIILLPGVAGLCLGLMWSKGMMMALLFPLALGFIFMVTAWTYCVRGWLIALMVNPRRRRTVLMALGLSLALIGQIPNIYVNVFARKQFRTHKATQAELSRAEKGRAPRDKKAPPDASAGPQTDNFLRNILPPGVVAAHSYVPVLWLPKGAMALAEGNAWPAIFGTLGGFLLAGAGLTRAYQSTIRFYRGQETAGAAKTVAPVALNIPARPNFLEKHVPFFSEEVGALALAFFRSMSRAPEIKMTLFTGVIVLLAITPVVLLNPMMLKSETALNFMAVGAVGITFLGFLQVMFNVFGYDRDGFRALVLLPARRRDILLAKNAALAPAVAVMGTAFLAALVALAHLPLLAAAAGLFKLAAMFLLLSVAGNLVSVWVPYRVTAGSLKPTKPPAKTVLLILGTQFLLPILMIPLLIPPALGLVSGFLGWWPAPLVDGILSFCLFGVAAAIYWVSLEELGRMLERREKQILLVVSRETE